MTQGSVWYPLRNRNLASGVLVRCLPAVACLALLLVSGCSSPMSSTTPNTNSQDPILAGSGEEAERTPHARLGYRLDWRGYPASPGTADLRHFIPLGDAIVYHDTRNNLSILETDTGRIRWSISLGSPLTSYPGHARIGDRLVTASDTDVQYFDIRTGNLVDRARLHALASSGPVVMGTLAIFGSATGEAYAIRVNGGFKQWGHMLNAPITASPVKIDDTNVAFVSNSGDVIIVDAESGSALGRRQQIYNGIDNNPVTDGRALYIAGLDQSVWAFNVEDGRLLWRLRTEAPITAQPAVWNGMVLLELDRKGFTAINASTGDVLWSNQRVAGEAVAARSGDIIVWDGEEAIVLDARRGDVIERVPFSGFRRVLSVPFEDGSLYTVSPDSTINKYSPST